MLKFKSIQSASSWSYAEICCKSVATNQPDYFCVSNQKKLKKTFNIWHHLNKYWKRVHFIEIKIFGFFDVLLVLMLFRLISEGWFDVILVWYVCGKRGGSFDYFTETCKDRHKHKSLSFDQLLCKQWLFCGKI